MAGGNDNGGGNGGGQGGDGWRDLAKVGVSLSSFVGVIGALAVTGLLGRTERDQGDLFLIATGLVLFAAVLWVSAAIFKGASGERALQVIGLVLLAGGFVCGFIAVLKTQHSPNRPTISAELDGGNLKATVKAAGLNSSDRIIVYVDGLTLDPASTTVSVVGVHRIYFASIGADGDGNVDEPIKLTVDSGRWDAVGIRAFAGDKSECATGVKLVPIERAGPGCVILPLTAVPRRPQIKTAWGTEGKTRTLTAEATVANAGGRLISLRVEGRVRRSRTMLARATAEPSPAGDGAVSLRVVVPARIRTICVDGRLTLNPPPRRLPACSTSSKHVVAASILRVPPR